MTSRKFTIKKTESYDKDWEQQANEFPKEPPPFLPGCLSWDVVHAGAGTESPKEALLVNILPDAEHIRINLKGDEDECE